MAKKKNIFEDPTIIIQNLTTEINEDIKNINNKIFILQQIKNNRKNKQSEHHSETVIDSLKLKLKNTTKDFSNILELRTEVYYI